MNVPRMAFCFQILKWQSLQCIDCPLSTPPLVGTELPGQLNICYWNLVVAKRNVIEQLNICNWAAKKELLSILVYHIEQLKAYYWKCMLLTPLGQWWSWSRRPWQRGSRECRSDDEDYDVDDDDDEKNDEDKKTVNASGNLKNQTDSWWRPDHYLIDHGLVLLLEVHLKQFANF